MTMTALRTWIRARHALTEHRWTSQFSAAVSPRSSVTTDRWVALVIIAIALILAVGLATAWWITCQNRGMYPALDMPNFNQGGTFKAYCKK